MLDYIIVGFGLSGLSFAEHLENNKKSYIVFEDHSQKSSRVAGGLYNPIILKRFTLAWQGLVHNDYALPFYKNIEFKFQKPFITHLPILRRFNSVEEQNTWFEASDNPDLDAFLCTKLVDNENQGLYIPFRYGKVNHVGKIEINTLLDIYIEHLKKQDRYKKESFDHDKVILHPDSIEYKGIKARHIVFSEGFGVKKNPFFNHLPLYGNKGEYIIIEAPALQLYEIVKSAIFIIPLGEDNYKVGATYNRKDTSLATTHAAHDELKKKLDQVIQVPYKIVDQVAGIRPTVKDRRPLVGTHSKYKNIHILNGMGSRGILAAPLSAKKLYDHIEKGKLLDEAISIKRFGML